MSHTITITKEVFSFSELSDKAKDKAICDNNETNHDSWWDSVYEDFTKIVDIMGFSIDVDNINFTLNYSQGDVAEFFGMFKHKKGSAKALKAYAPQDEKLRDILKDITAIQRRNFYNLEFNFSHSVYHGYNVDSVHTQTAWGEHNDLSADKDFKKCLESLSSWLYNALVELCDHYHTGAAFEEMADSNGYQFDIDGNLV